MEWLKKYITPRLFEIAIIIGSFIIYSYTSQAKNDTEIANLKENHRGTVEEISQIKIELRAAHLKTTASQGDNKVLLEKIDSIRKDVKEIKSDLKEHMRNEK